MGNTEGKKEEARIKDTFDALKYEIQTLDILAEGIVSQLTAGVWDTNAIDHALYSCCERLSNTADSLRSYVMALIDTDSE